MEGEVEWLCQGDPCVAWQAMRDLAGAPESVWQPVRARIPREGWGLRFVEALGAGDEWPACDWCAPVWILNLLVDLGFPSDHPSVQRAAQTFLTPHLADPRLEGVVTLFKRTPLFKDVDLCHLGFWLRIGCHFGIEDPALERVAEIILALQMPDGGWNCRSQRLPKTHHSSFNTTLNVLEGLAIATRSGVVPHQRFAEAESRALEFLLMHRLYKSDRTGRIVHEKFTRLTYPWHYHYRLLRVLDYFADKRQIGDDRLTDAVELLKSRRNADGTWPSEKPIAGSLLFGLEKRAQPSRLNTLKALRFLKARTG